MKLVNKISVKTVCGKVKTVVKTRVDADGNQEPFKTVEPGLLMRVAGICTGSDIVSTAYGDSVRFKGEFAATDLATGEIFQGGQLFLPEVAEKFVAATLDSVKNGENFQGLELAFDIGVEPANTPSGYQYTVAPLIQQAAKSRAEMLLLSLTAELNKPRDESKPSAKISKKESAE